MPVVRLVTVAALVVWLGSAMQIVVGDWLRPIERVTYVCGAVMLVGLLVMKLVGPPPQGFVIRVALVALVLGVTAAGQIWGRSVAATTMSVAVGLVLLAWYARE